MRSNKANLTQAWASALKSAEAISVEGMKVLIGGEMVSLDDSDSVFVHGSPVICSNKSVG